MGGFIYNDTDLFHLFKAFDEIRYNHLLLVIMRERRRHKIKMMSSKHKKLSSGSVYIFGITSYSPEHIDKKRETKKREKQKRERNKKERETKKKGFFLKVLGVRF